MAVTEQQSVGTWQLASFHLKTLDGQITYPFGKEAIGYYLFSESGYMSVTVMAANRSRFAAGDLMGGTTEEKVKAAETYITYSGKYEVKQDKLVVHPEVAFFPNWIGGEQVRLVEFSGDELSLSTPLLLLAGQQQTAHLVWKRVTSRAGLIPSQGLSHIAFRSSDLGRTERFYTEVLGGVVTARRDPPGPRLWLQVRGIAMEIAPQAIWPELDDEQRSAMPTLAFLVAADEVDTMTATLAACGVPYLGPVLKSTGGGVGVYFADPDGNSLALSCNEGYIRAGLERAERGGLRPIWSAPYAWPPAS